MVVHDPIHTSLCLMYTYMYVQHTHTHNSLSPQSQLPVGGWKHIFEAVALAFGFVPRSGGGSHPGQASNHKLAKLLLLASYILYSWLGETEKEERSRWLEFNTLVRGNSIGLLGHSSTIGESEDVHGRPEWDVKLELTLAGAWGTWGRPAATYPEVGSSVLEEAVLSWTEAVGYL